MGIVTCPQNVLINNKLSFFLEKKMSKKTFFKTFVQDCWLIDPAFNSWLEKVNDDLTIFQCKFCKSQNSLSNMGKRAIINHMEGQIHKNLPSNCILKMVKNGFSTT